MARSVADAAALLDRDGRRGRGRSRRRGRRSATFPTTTASHLKPDALKGARIGVLRQAMGYHPDVDAAIEARDRRDEGGGRGGGRCRDRRPTASGTTPSSRCCCTSSRTASNAYLANSGAPHASLQALIEWNKAHAGEAMPLFGQEIFEKAQAKGPLTDAAYLKARDEARRLAARRHRWPRSTSTSSTRWSRRACRRRG